MDGSRFDQLARALSGAGNRRGLLRMVAALPFLSTFADIPDVEAKSCAKRCRKKNNKKARRRCRKRCQNPPPPVCETSADCPPGEVCEDGQCIAEPDQCTTNDDCADCEACDDGACVSTCEQGAICRHGECCQPLTVCPDGRDCGVMDDECGGLLRCGPDACDNGYFCFDNRCFCPDGYAECEGMCCENGEVCARGDGPCCPPDCEGKGCGASDGCGGRCPGSCDNGYFCIDNYCFCPDGYADCGAACCVPGAVCDQGGECCTPDCEGKACGEDDGCGGACQTGSCPTCHSCREGTCEQEFPGTFCGGTNDETICLFDGRCGAFTCEDNSDCPGSCSCATSQFSNLCYEGSARGCPDAEPCVNFNCPPRFECRICPGGERCIPLCAG